MNTRFGKMACALVIAAPIALAGCGEDPDAAYDRGYDDGTAAVCNDIYHFNSSLFDRLEDERIC